MFHSIDPRPSRAQLLPVIETALHHLELAAVCGAGFLFDQVVLHSTSGLDSVENLPPWRVAFTERDIVAAVGRPILAVHALDPTRVRVDPGNRVGADLQAGADVELQHDVLRRAGREHVHRTLPVYQTPLDLMV